MPNNSTAQPFTYVYVLKKHWPKWDKATIAIDSYRLQFCVIDLNEDGLIDFNELYVALPVLRSWIFDLYCVNHVTLHIHIMICTCMNLSALNRWVEQVVVQC